MTQAATLAQLASSGALSADTSGNVGIGTTTPVVKLDVSGDAIRIQKSVNPIYYAYDTRDISGAAGYWIFQSNGGATATTQAYMAMAQTTTGSQSGYMFFATNGGSGATERMRIDASGNLYVGNTGNVSSGRVEITKNGERCLTLNNTATGAAANEIQNFIRNGAQVGNINTTGSATTYTTSSDYRLKENVQPMVGALDKVAQLNPVTYKWKLDGSNGQGFIAHELQEVVPDAVTGEKDAVNEDGSIKPQGIDTSVLVATLTAALQELKAELDVCKAEIAALKGV